MPNLTNLRDRPFLIVNTITRPAKDVDTSSKGWGGNKKNWSIFERPLVADRISNKVLREATVIVDIMAGKCITNRFEAEDDKVAEHYLGKYMKECEKALSVWLDIQTKAFIAGEGESLMENLKEAKAKAKVK